MTLLGSIGTVMSRPAMQAVAGLMSGALAGGALVATGAIPFGGSSTAAPSVVLMACPDSGPVLAQVADGQALLVTARSADGTWLQVHVGQPGVDRGWAPAAALRMESAADALPVADCSGPSAAPLGSPTPNASAIVATPVPASNPPSPTPTAAATPTPTLAPTPTPGPTPTPTPRPTPTPTPRPTPKPTPKPTPAPTPTPTPTPDTTPPSLSNLVVAAPEPYSGDGQHYIYVPSCLNYPHSATITVTATDNVAVASVTLFIWPAGVNSEIAIQMSQSGNTWTRTFTAEDSWSFGLINYRVRAVDAQGNEAHRDHFNNEILNKGSCALG